MRAGPVEPFHAMDLVRTMIVEHDVAAGDVPLPHSAVGALHLYPLLPALAVAVVLSLHFCSPLAKVRRGYTLWGEEGKGRLTPYRPKLRVNWWALTPKVQRRKWNMRKLFLVFAVAGVLLALVSPRRAVSAPDNDCNAYCKTWCEGNRSRCDAYCATLPMEDVAECFAECSAGYEWCLSECCYIEYAGPIPEPPK